MASGKRNTFPFKVKIPKVEGLLALSQRLSLVDKNSFEASYGLILDLLPVKIDPVALTTLAQFFDSPLRCFTFQDFQLAPTLEEFERISGCNLKSHGPYLGLKEDPTLEAIAESLHLGIQEIAPNLEIRGNTKGFTRKFLEAKARSSLANKEGEAFNAILALLIYGLVLFPNMENIIDLPAIGVFLTKNPVPTLLADFYHSLHARHEKGKGGIISCCTPLVHVWLMSHMPRSRDFVENRAKLKWSQRMLALTEKDIHWFSPNLEDPEIILSCGDFPNVPLIGTKGCINYNPVLSLRQLGYSMDDKPGDLLLEPFFLREGDQDLALLERIRGTWNQMHKGKVGKRNCVAKPLYTQWVKERVKIIKLPFGVICLPKPHTPKPTTTIPNKEAEELKAKIRELQNKNGELELKHLQALGETTRMKRSRDEATISLLTCEKRLRISEGKREWIGGGLVSADSNLIAKDEELERVLHSNQELKRFGELAIEAQRKWRLKFQEKDQQLQVVVKDYKEQLQAERVQRQRYESLSHQGKLQCNRLEADIKKYEEYFDKIAREHGNHIARLLDEIRSANIQLAQRKEVIEFVWQDATRLSEDFTKLVAFSNMVIAKLPKKLAKAELVMPYFDIPKKVKTFMKFCKDTLDFYREEIAKAEKRAAI